jgi:hypothetical protein
MLSVNIADIAGRIVHLINVSHSPFFCTDEVVRVFTDFSGRHVVLKILTAMRVIMQFLEIERKDMPALFEDLET